MSIQFLQTKDFEVQDDYLKLKNNGFVLVLFYATECPHCKPIVPFFHKLPSQINGCKFALVNVTTNHGLVNMSRGTKVPLEFVPTAILYYNKNPYRRYNQPYTENHIKQFLQESAEKINKFKNNVSVPSKKETPAFTLGVPVCDSDSGVCYLAFDSAYGKRNELKTHDPLLNEFKN